MTRSRTVVAAVLALVLAGMSLAKDAGAFPDQYMGDSSIYADLPSSVGRPNVLFIIDNSNATLNVASNVEYDPTVTYPISDALGPSGTPLCPTSTTDDPGKGCFQPWNVYQQDNQGDFAIKVFDNTTIGLEGLHCDAMPDAPADPIRQILQTFGTYSGAGNVVFPNLNGDGTCDVSNPTGRVYAMGNYLNYLQTEAVSTTTATGETEAGCTPAPADQVRKVTCPEGSYFSSGACKKPATIYYRAQVDHTSASTDENALTKELDTTTKWVYLGPTPPAGTITDWATGQSYLAAETCGVVVADTTATQRQIIWEALGDVISYASTIVNFGAISYGDANKGGKRVAPMADLSRELGTTTLEAGNEVIITPDCSANATLPYCQFLQNIPGPGSDGDPTIGTDGEPVLSSGTARPQAESLYDAGYYFGATYTPISIGYQLTAADPNYNQCGINHIILLTNGFSNVDGDPKLATVGDADGDNYPDEYVYGLGSHYLDDVARYLQANHGMTTHTVLVFQTADDLIRNAAKDGGGRFYNAFNRQQLAAALLDLLGSIVNKASTSFVAPVVPASTTNRTISSNRVYLGLFKPQNDGPWYGNIKKYGLNRDNRLTEPPASTAEINGEAATYPDGEFMTDSISFWSLQGGVIPAAGGDIDPDPDPNAEGYDVNARKGDGAEVAAGGVGGVLLRRVQALSAAIKSGGSTAELTRDIFTFIGGTKVQLATSQFAADPEIVITATQMDTWLGLPDTTLNWWDGGGTADGSGTGVNLSADDLLYHQNNLLRYLHGFDSLSVDVGESIWDVRKWVMGDILHSRPVVFNYTNYTHAEENLCDGSVYNSSVIFVGGNDGLFHAYRDCDGKELWAFAPDSVLDNLKYLPDTDGNTHTTYLDSPPAILFYDRDEDGEVNPGTEADPIDKVIIIFGMRRGGGKNTLDGESRGAYYALDITDKANPELLWKLDLADYPQLAETWAIPVIKPIKVAGSSDVRYVAFISAGYDNNEDLRYGDTQAFPSDTSGTTNLNLANKGGSVDGLDAAGDPLITTSPGSDADGYQMRGRGVAAVLVAYLTSNGETGDAHRYDIVTNPSDNSAIGTVIWNYAPTSMKYSLATDLRTLDLNNNGGYVDTIYAGDLGGNLWRFDTTDRTPSNWAGEIIFSSNSTYATPYTGYIDGTADNNAGRKIFYPPAVAKVGNTTYVCFGTGDREHPLNLAVTDRLYCVKDFGQTTAEAIDEANLVDITENELQLAGSSQEEVTAILDQLRSSPSRLLEDGTHKYGWYIRLDGKDRTISGDRGEKELAEAVVFNNEVYFSTYQLKTGVRAGCEAGNLGVSRLYRLDLETGEAVFNYYLANDTESTTTNDRAIGAEKADGTTEVLRRTDRVKELGEGIPSGIVQVVDAAGNVSLLISSSDKVEGIGGANPTSTFPVYWIQR